MKELIDQIFDSDLSPNQYVLLYCIQNSVDGIFNFDIKSEKKALTQKGYLNHLGEVIKSPKKIDPIDTDFLGVNAAAERDLTKLAMKIQQCFPPIITGSGHLRTHLKRVRDTLKLFLSQYDYDRAIILEATANYVKRLEKDGYKYARNSASFILKDGESTLALECDILLYEKSRGIIKDNKQEPFGTTI